MKFFEKILYYLIPTFMILSKDQRDSYAKGEKENFRLLIRFIFPIVSLAYIGHYFFLDRPLNLQPESLWMKYRFGVATLCLLGFWYYSIKKVPVFFSYKLPALLISFTICYLQAETIVWYSEVPYIYAFLFIILNSFALGLGPLEAIVFATVALSMQWTSFLKTDLNQAMLMSGSFVTVFFSVLLASVKYFQAKVFVANQNLLRVQKKNIEQSIEFTKKLKSFLPRKIAERLDEYVSENGMSVTQALDEVLRPKRLQVACLICDIRKYTSLSKTDKDFVMNSVIPLTKTESVIVENHNGIPRKIGDMLFCYFDSPDVLENLQNALLCGFDIAQQEQRYNESKKEQADIRKHILVSVGEAVVGNIGGVDSSIEITAMGTVVNFVNRLEGVIKMEPLKSEIDQLDVVISNESAQLLKNVGLELEMNSKNLQDYNLSIKDFEEVKGFYLLRSSKKNQNLIESIDEIEILSEVNAS